MEDIARTIDEQPATKILVQDAAPLAGILVNEITKIITLERDQPATPERKALLGMMADTRGTTARGLANIRAFLLTGNQKFHDLFNVMWKKNGIRFGDLKANKHLLTPQQLISFNKFAAARTKFLPLPARMFEIRGSRKWNMANYLLVTEAAPRAAKLFDTVLGKKDEKGVRQGGMVANQQRLLTRDASANEQNIATLSMIEWILLAVGLGVTGVIAFFSIRSIVTPVVAMTDAMTTLADGNLDIDIPAQDRSDEIGDMANAVQVFKDNAIRVKEMESEQEVRKAEQEAAEKRAQEEKEAAAIRAEEEKREAMNNLADNFESSVGGIVNSVASASTQMQNSATAMSATAEQTTQQSATVAAASEEASTNVQTVASAAEELSSSIDEINRQVTRSSDVSSSAKSEAQSAEHTIQGLADSVQKIGEVVELITDIAEQTNLLAPNATIESARAGEAGKGFAVVANEVKNLAAQTSKATEEISLQIGAVQASTDSSVSAVQGVSRTITELNEIATAISAAVEQQGAATQEIARNVEQASAGMQEVNSNIADITMAAGETGSAAGEIATAANDLSSQSETLKEEVRKFLTQVRAA